MGLSRFSSRWGVVQIDDGVGIQIDDGVGTPTVALSANMKKPLALVLTVVALSAAGVAGGWHWGHSPSYPTPQASGWASGS